jgi:hypothetical protein
MTVLEIRPHGFLVGFHGSRGIEQFHQARLVRITRRRFPIWLDPFRDVGPADHCGSVAVVLSKCGLRGASLLIHLKASSVPRNSASKASPE